MVGGFRSVSASSMGRGRVSPAVQRDQGWTCNEQSPSEARPVLSWAGHGDFLEAGVGAWSRSFSAVGCLSRICGERVRPRAAAGPKPRDACGAFRNEQPCVPPRKQN